MRIISSLQNPQIKNLLKLRKAKQRKKQELIIIEGRAEIKLALKANIDAKELFFCQDYVKNNEFINLKNVRQLQISSNIFKKISIRENPDGYILIAKPTRIKLEEIRLVKNPLIVVIEKIEKPGNLGAIMRTADAAGVDLVIACDQQTDIYNHNAVRASLGTIFTNKIVVCNTKDALIWLKKQKVRILATSPQASDNYLSANYKGAIALLIGSEHSGLSKICLDSAQKKLKIPMKGQINSLNASVSAALIIFEALRQRK